VEDLIISRAPRQDETYIDASNAFGPALDRLARAYEADSDKRRDLLQEIHFQMWRSFARFDGRCSLRTWIYRVAHHTAVSYVLRERRTFSSLLSLEDLDTPPEATQQQGHLDRRIDSDRLLSLIQRLRPLDRQVIVCYLEDMDAAAIGEISAGQARDELRETIVAMVGRNASGGAQRRTASGRARR